MTWNWDVFGVVCSSTGLAMFVVPTGTVSVPRLCGMLFGILATTWSLSILLAG